MLKLILFVLVGNCLIFSQDYKDPKYKEIAEKIYIHAHKDSSAWDKLAFLCDNFGNRISGSENLERAIDWVYSEMQKDSFANVKKEPCLVPKCEKNCY